MTSKKHRKIIYGVAIHLLVISVICYAAFPVKTPEQPIRLMYQTNAGKVLFDHQTHASVNGYGLDCSDCHHHPEDDDMALVGCVKCHPDAPEKGVSPEYCLECHDSSEIEDVDILKRSDAFHKQCTQCHEEFGKGPQSGSQNCSKCHVL